MINTVDIIEEVSFDDGVRYDIAVDLDDGSDPCIVARCWDPLLAEKIRDEVKEFFG